MEREKYFTIPAFAYLTGRSVPAIKRAISDGELPTSPGRYLGRDQDMSPMFAHLISEKQADRFMDQEWLRSEPDDPTSRREAVMRGAYQKRNEQVAVEAGDPQVTRAAGLKRLDEINAEAQAVLRNMIFGR